MAFNPQSTQIATASMDTTARLWDVETGAETSCFKVSICVIVDNYAFQLNQSITVSMGVIILLLYSISEIHIFIIYEMHSSLIINTLLYACLIRFVISGLASVIRCFLTHVCRVTLQKLFP